MADLWNAVQSVIFSRRSATRRNLWTVSLLDLQPDDCVLEVGFGSGVAIEAIASIVTGGIVAGIEQSPPMLARATLRNRAAIEEGRVELHLGTLADHPDLGRHFDKILLVNVAHFLEHPESDLRWLASILLPGGRLALTNQPRGDGASNESSMELGRRNARLLEAIGLKKIRVEVLPLRPVAVTCAMAEKEESGNGAA